MKANAPPSNFVWFVLLGFFGYMRICGGIAKHSVAGAGTPTDPRELSSVAYLLLTEPDSSDSSNSSLQC
jgi:hypothetical protein